MTYRVVQWTTGNVGKQSVAAIVANPNLELVGCFSWSADKVGRDAGELCGLPATGVIATDDVAALLALQPDCVVYNPMWPDVEEMVRILESGINIVSTAAFITGYDSPATELPVGFGRPIDDPNLLAMTTAGTAVFQDVVHLLGDALGVEFDEVVCTAEYAQTTKDLDLGSWRIDAGCVAGLAASWHGKVNGRSIVELRIRWRKGQSLEPDWELDSGYVIEVDGTPRIRTRVEILPPPDFKGQTFGDFMVLGMITTAMPALDAIPQVVAAAPGIVTYTSLPLPLPRGVFAAAD